MQCQRNGRRQPIMIAVAIGPLLRCKITNHTPPFPGIVAQPMGIDFIADSESPDLVESKLTSLSKAASSKKSIS